MRTRWTSWGSNSCWCPVCFLRGTSSTCPVFLVTAFTPSPNLCSVFRLPLCPIQKASQTWALIRIKKNPKKPTMSILTSELQRHIHVLWYKLGNTMVGALWVMWSGDLYWGFRSLPSNSRLMVAWRADPIRCPEFEDFLIILGLSQLPFGNFTHKLGGTKSSQRKLFSVFGHRGAEGLLEGPGLHWNREGASGD